MLEQYKKEIQKFITKGKLDKAIKRLIEVLAEGELKNEVLGYSGRLSRMARNKRKNLLNHAEYTQEESKIEHAVISIRTELQEDDLSQDIQLEESNLERICVVATKGSEHQLLFKQLLNANYFKHVEYCDYTAVLEQESEGIDLYIFDHQEEQEPLLQTLLKDKTKPPVLIFVRGQLRWLFEPVYRDRYATANSAFSLPGRLKEVLETIKWLGR